MVEQTAGGLPVRPVPWGTFPLPFGYLLLPGAGADDVRAALLAGRLPARWPDELRGHELALAGDTGAALAATTGSDVVSRFNRFVMDPDSADADAVRRDLGPELGVLVDMVLFGLGLVDVAPAEDGTTGELRALVLSAQAALAVSEGRLEEAAALLTRAIGDAQPCYPALAGVLYGALGQVCRQAGDLPASVAALQAGIGLLIDTDLLIGCAELHVELAAAFHEQSGERRELLNRAVHHYHSALQLITVESAPDLFAAAHANLGSAYLTMPMVEASDQLRHGVAVASLRAALTVYTPATHPREWASAQLNLANALVYAPSTHQADNLVEAVELYEAVLVQRNRTDDPLAYARVLANQGNALAHLGMFDHARGKLVEARFIFEEFQEYDATHSVRGILDEIAKASVLQA